MDSFATPALSTISNDPSVRVGFANPKSAIRNPQFPIPNPQSAIRNPPS
jgi:hypothetical protein